jgi:DNA modification methylase
MNIKLYNENAWDVIATLPDKSVNAIITDPMYYDVLNMDELRRVCSGHIIMFCSALRCNEFAIFLLLTF